MLTDLIKPEFKVSRITNLEKDPRIKFDYLSLINIIKNKYVWKIGELSSLTLLINPRKKIVLIALHPGTEIDSYQANSSIIIQVLEGELKFNTKKESILIETSQSLVFTENIDYSMLAIKETVLVLTISLGDIHSINKKYKLLLA